MLYDNHGRRINYVRLAVTDRCNLRCFYCMPEEGIQYVAREDLLTYEEMLHLLYVLADMGIEKVRITGGEPFVRRDMMGFLEALVAIPGIQEVHITTNGTLTADLVPQLVAMGIKSVNLSLDTLDESRFFEITRRNVFGAVRQTLDALLDAGMPTKINMVVMQGRNDMDILPMAELAERYPIAVRYIEEMPFNGTGAHYDQLHWNHKRLLALLQERYPSLEKIPDGPFSTSRNYRVAGAPGTLGIIAAYSRTFCGTCNRIRLTPKGILKTCLYDDGVMDIRGLLRAGATDAQLRTAFLEALGNRAKDGFEAENRRFLGAKVSESMSTIGG